MSDSEQDEPERFAGLSEFEAKQAEEIHAAIMKAFGPVLTQIGEDVAKLILRVDELERRVSNLNDLI